MVKLTQAYFNAHTGESHPYSLREVMVNPSTVPLITPLPITDSSILPEGLDSRVEFSAVHLNNGSTIHVVGGPSLIEEKIRSSRRLLKG